MQITHGGRLLGTESRGEQGAFRPKSRAGALSRKWPLKAPPLKGGGARRGGFGPLKTDGRSFCLHLVCGSHAGRFG